MEFDYVAYTKDRKLVRGKLSAANDGSAANILSSSGYQVLSMKAKSGLLHSEKLNISLTRLNPKEVIMFARQMALLLSSGTDIIVSLELLQSQVPSAMFRKALAEMAGDIRGGNSLSSAMRKHPKIFTTMFFRSVSAGERSGNLEVVLRQMANYMERQMLTNKKIRGALTYPVVVLVVAVIVVAILVVFVLPTFAQLYSSFGANLPRITRIMLGLVNFLVKYGLALILGFVAIVAGIFLYARTARGRYVFDRALLHTPLIGRIINLNELARACRTMALLFGVGLPLPDIMTLAVQASGNRVASEAMADVQRDLIRGEGLSKPMSKNRFFLPLMVQMVAVGEETGSLDKTLDTVAETYEVEAEDKTTGAVEMIQPIMTITIGLVVGFIAVSMLSAMYGMYGQLGG